MIKVTNNCKDFSNKISKALEEALKDIELEAKAEATEAAPIISGTLKDGFTSNSNLITKTRGIVEIGNSVVYARKVELLSKKNKGFFKKALQRYENSGRVKLNILEKLKENGVSK